MLGTIQITLDFPLKKFNIQGISLKYQLSIINIILVDLINVFRYLYLSQMQPTGYSKNTLCTVPDIIYLLPVISVLLMCSP